MVGTFIASIPHIPGRTVRQGIYISSKYTMSNLSIIRSLHLRRNHSQLAILYRSDGGHFKAARNGYTRYHYAKYVSLIFEVVILLEQSHSDVCFVTPTREKQISN